MALVFVLAVVVDALSCDSRFHSRLDLVVEGLGTSGFLVGLTVRVAVVMSPPPMVRPVVGAGSTMQLFVIGDAPRCDPGSVSWNRLQYLQSCLPNDKAMRNGL